MIDFALGVIFGALIIAAYHHFKGPSALKTSPSLDLETIFEGVRHLMSQAADDLAARIAALPAELTAAVNAQAAALQAQLDAEKADHAADLTKLGEAVASITPPPPV